MISLLTSIYKNVCLAQEGFNNKDTRHCVHCGLNMSLSISSKKADSANAGRVLCNTCARVCLPSLLILATVSFRCVYICLLLHLSKVLLLLLITVIKA